MKPPPRKARPVCASLRRGKPPRRLYFRDGNSHWVRSESPSAAKLLRMGFEVRLGEVKP